MRKYVWFLLLWFPLWCQAATISVSPSQPEFGVQLKSNLTTGYRWQLLPYNSQLLTLLRQGYQAPNTHLIGAPGKQYFVFRAAPQFLKQPQQTTVTLVYQRPWEKIPVQTQQFTVRSNN